MKTNWKRAHKRENKTQKQKLNKHWTIREKQKVKEKKANREKRWMVGKRRSTMHETDTLKKEIKIMRQHQDLTHIQNCFQKLKKKSWFHTLKKPKFRNHDPEGSCFQQLDINNKNKVFRISKKKNEIIYKLKKVRHLIFHLLLHVYVYSVHEYVYVHGCTCVGIPMGGSTCASSMPVLVN